MIVRTLHRSVLLTLLTLLGFGVGIAESKQGAWVQPAKVLTTVEKPGGVADIQVAVASDKTAIAAWLQYEPMDPDTIATAPNSVMVSIRPPNGKFGRPFALTGGTVTLRNLKVVAGAGGITVTWQWPDGGIFSRTRLPGGSFGAVSKLSEGPYGPGDYELAMGSDGTTAAVWEQPGYLQPTVVQVAVSSPGGQFEEPVNVPDIPSDEPWDPAVGVAPDGRLTVAWRASRVGILMSEMDSRGQFSPPAQVSGSDRDGYPQVTVGGDGTTTITWYRSSTSNTVLYARTRPPGRGFLPAAPLASSQDPQESEVDVDGTGRITLVWSDWRLRFLGDGSDGNTVTRMVSWVPGSPPKITRLSTAVGREYFGHYGALGGAGASVAGSSDGSTTVVWPKFSGRETPGLFSSTWDSKGNLSEPVRISESIPQMAKVGVGRDGNAIAAWNDYLDQSAQVRTASTLPDYCSRSTFALGKFAETSNNGTARFKVRLGSSGELRIRSSTQVFPATIPGLRAGNHAISLRLRAKALRELARRGRTNYRVRIRFNPTATLCQDVVRIKEATLTDRML